MGKKIGHYDYFPKEGVILDSKDNVERDGYRDTETIINEMVFAGERLMEQRKEDYMFENDEEGNLDEAVKASLDVIDVMRELGIISRNIEAAKKQLLDKQKALVTPKAEEVTPQDKNESS